MAVFPLARLEIRESRGRCLGGLWVRRRGRAFFSRESVAILCFAYRIGGELCSPVTPLTKW